MLPFALLAVAAAAVVLEKPFTAPGFSAVGAATPGTEAYSIATLGQAGAVWLDTKVTAPEWTLDVNVECKQGTVPAGDSGFAIWLTSERLERGNVHGSADKWDGLAVMIDSLGWDEQDTSLEPKTPSAIRAHLNDGKSEFGNGRSAADQAFSSCRVDYRKVGPLSIRIGYGSNKFFVEVNNQICLMTDKVKLSGGYFGVSADSRVTAGDSFIVRRMAYNEGLDKQILAQWPEKHNAFHVEPPKAQVLAQPQVSQDQPQVPQPPVQQAEAQQKVYAELLQAITSIGDRVGALDAGMANNFAQNSKGDQIAQLQTSVKDLISELREYQQRVSQATTDFTRLQGEQSEQQQQSNQVVFNLLQSNPSVMSFILLLGVHTIIVVLYIRYQMRSMQRQKLL